MRIGRGENSQVAIIGGSGGSYVDGVIESGADILITGEAGYHHLRYAQAVDLPVILTGHFASEWVGLPLLKTELERAFGKGEKGVVVEMASSERGPTLFV